MSHHDQHFLTAPTFLSVDHSKGNLEGSVDLIVKGQGVVTLRLTQLKPFDLIIKHEDLKGPQSIRLRVKAGSAAIAQLNEGIWETVVAAERQDSGLDPDRDCVYWFSIDCHNRCVRYGKGEVRKNTMIVGFDFPPAPESPAPDPYAWVGSVREVFFESEKPGIVLAGEVWRDPVTIDPPLSILPVDQVTMDDIAMSRATVAANLTPACQQLYANVSGAKFMLDTPEFPDFVAAIEESIRNPRGWCFQTLKKKSGEFGKDNPDETYLRITMGVNQGDSPGIPFVMEIWPPGHYSPIHNHGGANAVIRVLSGEIDVKLFVMLSKYHEKPFMESKFGAGAVTWISPRLNQTHQLHNTNVNGPSCITIQCYMYGADNTVHYEYFDYLSEDKQIEQFTPNSDMGFMEFKATMKQEWENWNKTGAAATLDAAGAEVE